MTRHGPLDILGMIGQEREYEGLLAHTVEVEVAADVKVRVLDLETLIQTKEETAGERTRQSCRFCEGHWKRNRARKTNA